MDRCFLLSISCNYYLYIQKSKLWTNVAEAVATVRNRELDARAAQHRTEVLVERFKKSEFTKKNASGSSEAYDEIDMLLAVRKMSC